LGPKRGQPLYLNKSESPSPNHVSHQVWLKLAKWLVRRSRLKEKVNRDGQTYRRTPDNCDGNSSPEPGELKKDLWVGLFGSYECPSQKSEGGLTQG